MGSHINVDGTKLADHGYKLTSTSVIVVLSPITGGYKMNALPLERCKSMNGILIHLDHGTSLRFHPPGCSIIL